MRARIRTSRFDVAFEGSGALWNDLLRPILGGPAAPAEPVPRADADPALREPAPQRAAPARRASPRPPAAAPQGSAARSEPPPPQNEAGPRTATPARGAVDALMAALATVEGRRADRDAVLVAVWSLGDGGREVSFSDVAGVLDQYDGFDDLRVKPLLLKHISRSKMLESGGERETVRLTQKGRRYLAELARG